ncbi:uncharacterized protein [Haliotis cracherodii]|uniref:uncharacterized protein n=1 Tax=Haliotis cracherodii TaxID=6455 RepID=UPI0039E770E3
MYITMRRLCLMMLCLLCHIYSCCSSNGCGSIHHCYCTILGTAASTDEVRIILTCDSLENGDRVTLVLSAGVVTGAPVCHRHTLSPTIDTWYWFWLMTSICGGMIFLRLSFWKSPAAILNHPHVPYPIQEQHGIPEVHGVILCS